MVTNTSAELSELPGLSEMGSDTRPAGPAKAGDNAQPMKAGVDAAPAGPEEASDSAKIVRQLADFIQANRHKLKAAGKPAPDSWQDYVLGQTKRALAIEDSDKLRALIVEALASIGPRDAVEDMIAAQMLVCHDAAMECFAAQAPDKKNCSHEEQLYYRMKYLLLGGRLSRAFAMLLDALNYHRGKGQRRIVVEHVSVHSGGQAVVGNVRVRSSGDRPQIPKRKNAAATSPLPGMRSEDQAQRRGAVQSACDGKRALLVPRWQDTAHAERQ